MFSLLNRSNIFCITYKLKKSCKFCDISKLNNDDYLFLNPLIKVNKDNYNFDIDTLINYLLGIIYSRCPLCGYKEGIIINDKKYYDCLKIECYDFKLPLYLSFILDTEISDNSFINYKELIKHQFYWNKFLKGNFSLFNNNYELNNIITYPLNNHYTCSIKYAEIINNFYYYNDTLNNGYLSILKNNIHNNIKEQIKNNIYIIMLKKY
jgi:hypothetical protein